MFKDMATFFHILSKSRRRAILRNVLLLIPGVAADLIMHSSLVKMDFLADLFCRLTNVYITAIIVLIFNSLLLSFMDIYSASEKSRNHPLKALIQGLQVALFFVGGIAAVAILIDKSPKALLTGLGASAAVLMLIFKDSILGFVAGVQLSQNDMVRIGDWIQMPDGTANGTVEEITLNTVKVRNWDNTICMIPPYTLVSSPFINWRGMQESGGRRVDKMIYLDITSLEVCSEDMIADVIKSVPLMSHVAESGQAQSEVMAGNISMPNSQLYRAYVERYLRHHPSVVQNLDLFVALREPTELGLPIEIYFFVAETNWEEYEKIQSDIFDHLHSMVTEFGLRLYQYPQ